MNIQYLKRLRDNPSDGVFTNAGISEVEIAALELQYNGANPFPIALRELLFLAGNFCIVFDLGNTDTQIEVQTDAIFALNEYNRIFTRPIYVIDLYNFPDQFLFIYLDENKEDPDIFEAYLYEEDPSNSTSPVVNKVLSPLSVLVNARLGNIKDGLNPF